MGLPGRDPTIEFKKPSTPQVQAQWNTKTRRYAVNPGFIKTAGLPQYVALMGRFMDKNYDRCFGDGREPSGALIGFWNEFRHSTVGYLIQSVPDFSNVTNIGTHYPLFQKLKRLEAPAVEPVQRLALELLDRFDCDWSHANLQQKVLQISQERDLLPEKVIREAFASVSEASESKPLLSERASTVGGL